MIVKLTEYEVSYLTKNDIFIGKKRFNLIQFEGGKGCNKSCVQDFYFFFFELIHSFSVYFISSLFPLLGVQRSQWHRNENIHVNNQRANNDTDRYYRLFLLSSFFFFFFPSSRRSRSTSRFDEAAIHRSEQRLQPLSMLVDRALLSSTDETRIQRHVGWCICVADGEIDFHRKSTERSRRKRRIIIERFYY